MNNFESATWCGCVVSSDMLILGETELESRKNRAADPFSRTLVFTHGAPEGDAQRRAWIKSLVKKYNAKMVFRAGAQLTSKCEQVTLNLGCRKMKPLHCFQDMRRSVERRTIALAAWQEAHLSVTGLYVGQLVVGTSHPVHAKLYEQSEAAMQRLVDFMDTAPTNFGVQAFQEELLVKVVSQNAVQNVTGLTDRSRRDWILEVDDGKHKADVLDLARSKHALDMELGDLEPLILNKLASLKAKRTAELTHASCACVVAECSEPDVNVVGDYMAKLARDKSVYSTFRMMFEADRATHAENEKEVDQKQLKHARTLCDRVLLSEEQGVLRCKKMSTWGELMREAPGEQQSEKARMESHLGRTK
jgi:hypothetical protein